MGVEYQVGICNKMVKVAPFLALTLATFLMPLTALSQTIEQTATPHDSADCFDRIVRIYATSKKADEIINEGRKTSGGNRAVVTQLDSAGSVEIRQSGTQNTAIVRTPETTHYVIEQEGCRNLLQLIHFTDTANDWQNLFLKPDNK